MLGMFLLKLGESYFRVEAGVWDLEGTAVSVEPLHHSSHREVARILGLELPEGVGEMMKVIPNFYGGPDTAIYEQIRELARTRGVSGDLLSKWTVQKLLDQKGALFETKLRKADIEPREGLVDCMRLIEATGVKTGICSVTNNLLAMEIIKRSGMEGLLMHKPVLLRGDVKEKKPNPEVYLMAAERMGVSAKHLLVFEDSPTGVEAGVRAGAIVIGVPVFGDEAMNRKLLDLGAVEVMEGWGRVNTFLKERMYSYLEGVEGRLRVDMPDGSWGCLSRTWAGEGFEGNWRLRGKERG